MPKYCAPWMVAIRRACSLVIGVVLLWPGALNSANARDHLVWSQPTDGSFHDPTRWNYDDFNIPAGRFPESDDRVIFRVPGSYHVSVAELAVVASTLFDAGDVTLDLDAEYSVRGDLYGGVRVSPGASATLANSRFNPFTSTDVTVEGTMTVTNSGLISDSLYVGLFGAGSLRISSGGSVHTGDALVGILDGSMGDVSVSGENSKLTVGSGILHGTGSLYVGNGGAGSLTISSGGRVETDETVIGDGVGATGHVSVSGENSKLTVGFGVLYVGNGGAGSLTISSGGRVETEEAVIGSVAGATGDVSVSGVNSKLTVEPNPFSPYSGTLTVGDQGRGALRITGGASAEAYRVTIGGTQGTSTVALSNSAQLNVFNHDVHQFSYLDVGNTGRLTVASDSRVNIGGQMYEEFPYLTAGGVLTVSQQGLVDATTGAVSVGYAAATDGEVVVGEGGHIVLAGGTIRANVVRNSAPVPGGFGNDVTGHGTIQGDLTNSGLLIVGGSLLLEPYLRVTGNFQQSPTGIFNVAFGELRTVGTDLLVQGSASLDGAFKITGTTPGLANVGDRFNLMRFSNDASTAGRFASFDGLKIDENTLVRLDYRNFDGGGGGVDLVVFDPRGYKYNFVRKYGPEMDVVLKFAHTHTFGESAAGLVLFSDPVTAPLGVHELYKQAFMLGLEFVAEANINDPPSTDYKTVFIPQVPVIPIPGLEKLPQNEAGLLRSSVDLQATSLATLQAMLVTGERASGAKIAGDTTSLYLQDQAFGRYQQQLADLSDRLAVVSGDLAGLFENSDIGNIALSASDVADFQRTLRLSGLPAEERDFLAAFGLTAEDLQAEVNELLAIDPSTLAGVTVHDLFMSDSTMYAEIAQAVRAVPEPASLWLLVAALPIVWRFAHRKPRRASSVR